MRTWTVGRMGADEILVQAAVSWTCGRHAVRSALAVLRCETSDTVKESPSSFGAPCEVLSLL